MAEAMATIYDGLAAPVRSVAASTSMAAAL
jgi:hypothetical protein